MDMEKTNSLMESTNSLVVIDGPVLGERFKLKSGTFRLIGRLDQNQEVTMQVTTMGNQILSEDHQNLMQAHMESREDAGLRMLYQKRDLDILLEDPSVSKAHAMVFADEHGLSVADLMSTNGIQVNGQTFKDANLQPGDRLRIGSTLLLFDDTGRS
jgi:hypothetical protein